MATAAGAPGFLFVGGLLWLDFVNTQPMRQGVRVDLLDGFADLVRWLRQAGILTPAPERRAVRRWGASPVGAEAFEEAVALRAALRSAADRLADGRPPGEAMVRALNRVLGFRPAYPRLERRGGRFVTRMEPVSESPLHLLTPIAESAAWLLEQGEWSLVRRCGGNRCVLVFYDTTRNRSRRWCSMDGCGSRAKAAAYYRRTQGRD